MFHLVNPFENRARVEKKMWSIKESFGRRGNFPSISVRIIFDFVTRYTFFILYRLFFKAAAN